MASYTDKSIPPVGGNNYSLKRADGTVVTVTYSDQEAPPVPQPPKRIKRPLDLFGVLGADKDSNGNGSGNGDSNIRVKPSAPAPPRLAGHLQGRGPQHEKKPLATAPGKNNADDSYFDHPIIGGQFTAFVLLYGPEKFYDMHRQCLDSLIATAPKGRMELRVGSNALNPKSLAYVEGLKEQGLISLHYRHAGNDKKYPVMREMFWDDDHPIETNYLLWFDDDSICDRNANWMSVLAKVIVENHPKNCRMFGDKYIWSLKPAQREHYKTRPWYRGRPFRRKNGKPSENGDKVIFATGGFWALSTEAMREANIPDPEIGHNGGDYTIGEQLYQTGYDVKQWNSKKQFVNTSSVPRRGINEKHFGEK